MNKFPCVVLLLFIYSVATGQDEFSRFSDFHIHPTYKHYFRPKKAAFMQQILQHTKYDSLAGTITFDPCLSYLRTDNWIPDKNRKKDQLEQAVISNLRNYDQASYSELMFTPGSVLCNSFSPYEKQFALSFGKRVISSLLVTGMGLDRLNYYGTDEHCPFDDFMAEYFYCLLQEEGAIVQPNIPTSLYKDKKRAQKYTLSKPYETRIVLVKNGDELKAMLAHNEKVFQNLSAERTDTPLIFTPMVMSIEGAQVLYGPLSGKDGNIDDPLDVRKHKDSLEIAEEILGNVKKLMNLPHRLFFITLGHFAENHTVGYAKTLDRDPENFQHRILSFIGRTGDLFEKVNTKRYAGLNVGGKPEGSTAPEIAVQFRDSLGYQIVKAFLNFRNSRRHRKPTYIDVKHMDIKARIQYYYIRRQLEKELDVPIPIIASHFAVSGEQQAMAAATGLYPKSDKYRETERTRHYYNKYILKYNDSTERKKYWADGVMGGALFPKRHDSLDRFEKAMYKPLYFLDTGYTKDSINYDPFTKYKLDEDENVGWSYPWSINLFDEEIIEINKSDGIIGLLLDPRQLGTYAAHYGDSIAYYEKAFKNEKKHLDDNFLKSIGLSKDDLLDKEYIKSEPLLRNIFYIVRLIKYQQAAEDHYERGRDLEATQKLYSWFMPDDSSHRTKKDPWNLIALGSDYDGLIDPIDFAPTAAYVPGLQRRLVVYAYIFSKIHSNQFHLPGKQAGDPAGFFIQSLQDSKEKMRNIFYENGKNFISKYF